MKVVNQKDVGESFQVCKSFTELRKNYNFSNSTAGTARLDGSSFRCIERGMDNADGPLVDNAHGDLLI